MASTVKAFNNSSNWMNAIELNNNIEYFFTQRKIIETSEYIDQKTLERKQKKETVTHNFLAINLPIMKSNYKYIKIEIWGNNGYNYEGQMINYKGINPNLMLKLNNDTEMFVKMIFYEEDETKYKTFISFIPILKRYQKLIDNDVKITE